jgi:hypothetical protein
MQEMSITFVLKKITSFFRRKMAKIAENSDRNIEHLPLSFSFY